MNKNLNLFQAGDVLRIKQKEYIFQNFEEVDGVLKGVVKSLGEDLRISYDDLLRQATLFSPANTNLQIGQKVFIKKQKRLGVILEFCCGDSYVKVKLFEYKKRYFFGAIEKILPEKVLFLSQDDLKGLIINENEKVY